MLVGLKCPNLHLIDSDQSCNALQIGANFGISPISSGVELFIKNVNLTGWQFVANVTKNYAKIDPTILASFNFTPVSFVTKMINSVAVQGSQSFMSMTALESKGLILPPQSFPTITNLAKQLQKFLDDQTIEIGVNCWVYEVKIVSPTGLNGGVYPVIKPSLVQVIDESTVIV